ncbi:retrovirus-related pol polyprotein from transposon TNT 1-94 [Tanacetum coccineum]
MPPVKNVSSKVKQVWKATGKLFAIVGYQWKPTGRKFTFGEQCPLTRFTKSKVVPLKQPEHISSSEIVITKRFSNTTQTPLTRYKLRNKQEKAISTGIPTIAKTQTIDASVKYTTISANQQDPNKIGDPTYQTLHPRLFSNAGRTDRPLVFGLRLLKTYDRELLTAQEFREKVNFVIQILKLHSENIRVIHDEVLSNLLIVKSLQEQICVVASSTKSFELRVSISHQKSVSKTPQQNGVVERRNRTLVEAARTMLIFSKAPMFLWAEAVATACYTQNRSLIHTRHNKTPYELVHDKKPDLTFLCIFLTEHMAPVRISSGPEPILLTPGQISSGLIPNPVPAALYVPPTNKDLEILFQPMFDEYFEPPSVERPVPPALTVQVPVVSVVTLSSTTIDQDAPSTSHSPSSSEVQPPISHQGVKARPTFEDNPFAQAEDDPFVNVFALDPSSEASSSRDVGSAESNQVIQPHDHLGKWSKDHLMDNVIDKMAEENVPAPTRTDEQSIPVKARLPIKKSNLLMDLQKMQKNPIFRISVDLLQNTNLFSAFTASANVPSIYI